MPRPDAALADIDADLADYSTELHIASVQGYDEQVLRDKIDRLLDDRNNVRLMVEMTA